MGTLLIFCAHSDDEAIGMAGTIAKYVSEKGKVIKVVFSSGEKSSPHLREDVVKKERSKETDIASDFLGITESINLNLKDAMLKYEIEKPFVAKRVKELIMLNRPEKIFIPSGLDPHPDHRAVNRCVMEVVFGMKKHYSVYAYEVWNIIDETHPLIYVDISKFLDKKMEYIKMFRSQWLYMFTLYLPTWIRNFYYGRKNNCEFAERFYKLR
jgi:LmbE family N-acetylglucosaminyl deacetylase